jgi:hypothetical protein
MFYQEKSGYLKFEYDPCYQPDGVCGHFGGHDFQVFALFPMLLPTRPLASRAAVVDVLAAAATLERALAGPGIDLINQCRPYVIYGQKRIGNN